MSLQAVCALLGSLTFLTCIAAWNGLGGILFAALAGCLVGSVTWLAIPTMAGNFYDLPLLLSLGGLLGVVAIGIRSASSYITDGDAIARKAPAIGLLSVGMAWTILLWVTSWGMFNAAAYRDIVQVVERPLDNSIELIDQTHARLVDADLAKRRALELLGTAKGLGSSYVVGDPVVQLVAGRQVWVAPLEPAGFWAWQQNDASPGYVVVSATNYSDAEIRLDRPLRYTKESWFGRNVERRAWTKEPTIGQTDYSFEIDDAGKPYWIVSLYDNVAGGSGPKVVGVMTVDAASGETLTYDVGKEPEWIDRVQPEWIAEEQLTLWGDYVKGWPNFANSGVVHPTSGMSLVHLKDGRSAWFTGVVNLRSQSQNAAAADGFALYDSRLGTATVFYQQGVSESAAQLALNGAVQRGGYHASQPIAYTVHGALTYVSTLKDNAGNPQMVGMVSALDRSVSATGRTLPDVTLAYASRLRTASSRVTALGVEAKPQDVSGTLVRSGAYVLEGRGYQLVRLSVGGADRDFAVDLSIAALRTIVLARPGDGVELKILAGQEGVDEIREVRVVPRG